MKKCLFSLAVFLVQSYSNVAPASSPYQQQCPPGTYPQVSQYNGYLSTVCQPYRQQFSQPYMQPGLNITIPLFGRGNGGGWDHERREHQYRGWDRD